MKAVLFRRYGGPEVLEYVDVPDPVPGPGDVLIRVGAASVNRTLDVNVRAGTSGYDVTLPYIPGVDAAGTIVAVGAAVTRYRVGDRVTTVMTPPPKAGGYAELVRAPEADLCAIPAGLDFVTATIARRHFPAAYGACRSGELKAGETVLITGASGNFGAAAVQVAKSLGATVIAGAGADDRVAIARSLGADHAINYRRADLAAEVMRMTEGRGAQLAIESIGDAAIWSGAFQSLGRMGRLVVVGTHGGHQVQLDLDRLYRRFLTIRSGVGGVRPEDAEASLAGAASGRYRLAVHRVLPLAQAAEAHRIAADPALVGKVVLDPTRDRGA